MDKLFRQVKTSERIPTDYKRYETSIGNVHFLDFSRLKIEWWLEELEPPKIDNALEQRQEVYKKAGEKWGQYSQMEMAIEEALEFALAVRKQIRKSDDNTFAHMVEEFADLEIMMEQVEQMHSDSGFRDMVNAQKVFKIDRLLNILKGETNADH